MRTKTVVKTALDLTAKENQQCQSLSFRYAGDIMFDLRDARKRKRDGHYYGKYTGKKHKDSHVVMIKDESDRLIGWALLSPQDHRRNHVVQFYVRQEFRGRGYGSRLMKHALKIDPKPWVIPHDKRAGGLFKKYKNAVRYDRRTTYYRENMK